MPVQTSRACDVLLPRHEFEFQQSHSCVLAARESQHVLLNSWCDVIAGSGNPWLPNHVDNSASGSNARSQHLMKGPSNQLSLRVTEINHSFHQRTRLFLPCGPTSEERFNGDHCCRLIVPGMTPPCGTAPTRVDSGGQRPHQIGCSAARPDHDPKPTSTSDC